MCIVCLLRKAKWDYWELLGSEALYNEANKKKFYSVLTQYLNDYGPHFRNELFERFKFFLPRERRDQLIVDVKLENYFLRHLFSPKELKNNNIKATSLQNLVIKFIPETYDYFIFDKSDHKNTTHYLDRLLYTSENSLKDFIDKCDHKVEKRLIVTIRPLEQREPSHSKY